jgi:menaquinone-9 beta-reductase
VEVSRHYEVAIAGGGPAGCSAAILAARSGLRVLLLDPGSFPRHKVCGEFISPEAMGLLRVLLRADVFQEAPRLDSVEVFLNAAKFRSELSPPARSVTRYQLDKALWDAATSAGATCIQKTKVDRVSRNGKFLLDTSDGPFAADSFINAAGRWSNLDITANGSSPSIGIKAHYSEETVQQGVQLYFFDGGYCGVQPIGANRINVCAMVNPTTCKTFSAIFTRCPELRVRSQGWHPVMDPIYTAPLTFREPRPVVNAVIQVGDAAAFIDPFAGDGISLALHSGKLAADAISKANESRRPEMAAAMYEDSYYRMVSPVLRRSAFVREMISGPPSLRRAALIALRLPFLSKMLVRATRLAER